MKRFLTRLLSRARPAGPRRTRSRTARLCAEALEDRSCLSNVAVVVPGVPALPDVSAATVPVEHHLSVADAAAVRVSVSVAVSNPTTTGSAPRGSAGKAKFAEFTITKATDPASPAFFGNAEAGSHRQEMPVAGGRVSPGGCPRCETPS